MNGRLLLAMFIAVLPISVEMGAERDTVPARPGDPPLGAQTSVRAAGSVGEFAIIHRGCNGVVLGEVLGEVNSQLHGGALEVQHRFTNGIVIGARGGQVIESAGRGSGPAPATAEVLATRRTNAYANPYVGFDGPRAGVGVGWLHADQRFIRNEYETMKPDVTAHLRVGTRREYLTLRFMEGLPLESEGAFTLEAGGEVTPHADIAAFAGLLGPFDGALFGMKGDIWLTPEAAVSVRLGLSSHGQYAASAGAALRFGAH